MPPIRTVVTSRWPILRLCVEAVLDDEDEIAIAGLADDWDSATDLIRKLEPDVAVAACLTSRQHEAVLALRTVARRLECPVVVLGPSDPPAPIWWMLIAGVSGYVTFDQAPAALSQSIRAAAYGSAIYSAQVNPLAKALNGRDKPKWASLTNRERDVVRCVARGLTDADAAEELGITESTILRHVSRVMHKMGCQERVGLVARLFAVGILGAEDIELSGAAAHIG